MFFVSEESGPVNKISSSAIPAIAIMKYAIMSSSIYSPIFGFIEPPIAPIIEDDIISGRSLQLVVGELLRNEPSEINLFLGHSKGIQHLDNIPGEISRTFIVEDIYACCDPISLEQEFLRFFTTKP